MSWIQNIIIEILEIIIDILDVIDQHEGSIAMFGIAISVLIFRKEVSNNYFTLEKDNFNEIFKKITLEELPEKISGIEEAIEADWSKRFSELMEVLENMLENAKYFKYSMPYFYKCLKEIKEEIGDLERHDNWKLYRNSAKQNELIEKKCREIIRTINNASKGRVFRIKWRQNKIVNQIKRYFVKAFIDSPNDRISETYSEGNVAKVVDIYTLKEEKRKIDIQDITYLKSGKILIKPANSRISIVGIKAIWSSEKFFFGYMAGIRFGKKIGKTQLKAKVDKSVYTRAKGTEHILTWDDRDIHKIIVLWRERGKKRTIYFDTFKIVKREGGYKKDN